MVADRTKEEDREEAALATCLREQEREGKTRTPRHVGHVREREGGCLDRRREITEEGEEHTLRQVVRIITSNGKRRLWVTMVAYMRSRFVIASS